MDAKKRKKLEAAGWRVSSVDEFLDLSPEESLLVDLKIALSRALKIRRTNLKLTQHALAQRIRSSQSRVAKMEAGDPQVTLDLLFRGLFATGASRQDVARVVAQLR